MVKLTKDEVDFICTVIYCCVGGREAGPRRFGVSALNKLRGHPSRWDIEWGAKKITLLEKEVDIEIED